MFRMRVLVMYSISTKLDYYKPWHIIKTLFGIMGVNFIIRYITGFFTMIGGLGTAWYN